MKILIVGANGYVGNALVEHLSVKHEVIAAARNPYSIPHAVQKVPLDITDAEQARQVLQKVKPDLVIHAAGMPKRAKMDETAFLRVNVDGTAILAQAVLEKSDADLIYISSGCAFHQEPGQVITPDSVREDGNAFSVSKNLAENKLLSLYKQPDHTGRRLHILYPPIILHPGQVSGIIPRAYDEAVSSGVLINKLPGGHINAVPSEKLAELIEKVSTSDSLGTINHLPITGIRLTTENFFVKTKAAIEAKTSRQLVIEEVSDPAVETMCETDEAWLQQVDPSFQWGGIEPHIGAIVNSLSQRACLKR